MRDPELFGHIDRVLAECDARQLPTLKAAALDPAGAAEHLVVTETAAELGPEPPRRRRIHWPWRRP